MGSTMVSPMVKEFWHIAFLISILTNTRMTADRVYVYFERVNGESQTFKYS